MADDACDLLCLDLPKAERLRAGSLDAAVAEELAARAAALGEPTRVRAALALRGGGELCVCDLAWVLGKPEKSVSHHLRLMRAAGVVRSRKDGRMVLYALTGPGAALVDLLAPAVEEVHA